MYESPALRRMRQVTAEATDDADFTERLVDAIQNDPDVRAAILRLVRAASSPAKKPTPAKRTPAARTGRGR